MNNAAKNKKRKITAQSLKIRLSVLQIYSIIITIAFCIMGIKYMNQHNDYHKKLIDIESRYKYAIAMISDFNITIDELMKISETLDSQNKALVEANQAYYDELEELREKAELYDHYSYAMVDSYGNRTDITYDQLKTLEELMKDAKVNDPDLILSWVMTESGGKENAKNPNSTAKGYGQFLDGTSRFVYSDLLNRSDWTPSVALDGETNLEMMVVYIDYLYERNGNDLYDAIRSYRGKKDISGYVNKIDSYLMYNNKSVYQISLNLKE